MLEGVFECDCGNKESGTNMVNTCTILSREGGKNECGGYTFIAEEDDE